MSRWNNKKRLTNYQEWHSIVTTERPEPPEPLTKAAFGKLPAAEQSRHRKQRLTHHSQFPFFETSRLKKFDEKLRALPELNNGLEPNQTHGPALTGIAGAGKTTALRHYLREIERGARADDPNQFDPVDPENPDIETDRIYTICVSLPVRCTPLMLNTRLLGYMRIPVATRATKADTTTTLVDAMHTHGVEFLAIDDAHRFSEDKDGEESADHLKDLLSQVTATPVLAGVSLKNAKFLTSEFGQQLTNRLHFVETGPIKSTDAVTIGDTAAKEWTLLLMHLEGHISLRKHQPGDVTDLQDYLRKRTAGRLNAVTELLSLGCQRAIGTGTERVTKKLLDECETSWETQSRYDKFGDASKTDP